MKKRTQRRIKETLSAYGFLMPNFLGFLLFTSGPVIFSLFLAFTKWDIVSPMRWVGWENFIRLLWLHHEGGLVVANNPLFWKYVGNTAFLLLGIPIGMAGSLALALVMNQRLKGIVFFRTIFFLPTLSAGIAVFMLWRWLYNPEFGLINFILDKFFHIQGPAWLQSTLWAKPALMIMGLWGSIGGTNMILYLAGLAGIDPELYEAAAIDGANPWQKFWKISWPMLSPTTFFIFIMSIIGGFQQGFEMVYMMTQGGPAHSTTVISYYIWANAFSWFKMGNAAAIAWFLFLIIFCITLINWKVGTRTVHY